jgi:hypothetical protein
VTIKIRLRKLEGGDADCGVCGWPHWSVGELIHRAYGEPEPPAPETCPNCGRELRITLEWADAK